ncbi:MAG: fumarylacetoacetate hydrolase family protein [Acidobacteria bacterium]|nr:fumarylacetoacetate hydrolase family protein [Acidobacteriota bacterium]MBV9145803.1 fumarylacetoacetate hydrolase family protein [Acidobacteriota bacterium]MBV9434421.1 fumarylacetoacetate hydrolase family protein [Acidobacteriota bacterium]
MRYCKFPTSDGPQYGEVQTQHGEEVIVRRIPPPEEDRACVFVEEEMQPTTLGEARLLAPVNPSKIVCVGRNYREHAKELGNEVPVDILIFLKPPSSLLAPEGKILMPKLSQRVDYEGELAVVIGKKCRNATEREALSFVRGYTCANDVTARDLQKSDGQWTRGKGFDTFCPIGPVVTDEISPEALDLETRVNGELRQKGNTRDFIFSLPAVIRYISSVMTLLPGDVILTGTPAGVGPLKEEDRVQVSISGIGTLTNFVVAEGRWTSSEVEEALARK